MSAKKTVKRAARANAPIDLPFDDIVGYQVRMTHRALQRYLQTKIAPYGVTLGMWYHLRALWAEDGLTQRELSRRIGLMEPYMRPVWRGARIAGTSTTCGRAWRRRG